MAKSRMIDVAQVVRAVPHLETCCSVAHLRALVGMLATESPGFDVTVIGTSANGVPIHHLRFGSGSVKAFFLGGPHCPEQIGSLTVASLMMLLHQGNRSLVDSDVEWHVVPCIDPDGALLNEGWSQRPFTLERYMRHYYEQPSGDQVDRGFPIRYKKIAFDTPSREAQLLKDLLDKVRPDFFYTLHNSAPTGGTWYAISRDIEQKYYRQLHQLLQEHSIPLRATTPGTWCAQFAAGVSQFPAYTKFYDFLENTGRHPEEALQGVGAGSADYVASINDTALNFCSEPTHIKHPGCASDKATGQNLRQLKLRIDAENKYLASVILEEWEKVKEALDATSPYHRKISRQLIAVKDQLPLGVWDWNFVNSRDLLFNPADNKIATESERFNALMQGRFMFLCNAYGFVQLLKASEQTRAVEQAMERMERIFDDALSDLGQQIDLHALEVIDCTTLAKVQLGSGLIVLNSILEAQRTRA